MMDSRRGGFSLVEIIVALLILSVGILAMGASTTYIFTQVRASQLRTERMTAVNDAAEVLRATPFPSLGTACEGQTFDSGRYLVECSVLPSGSPSLRILELVSTGPGYRSMTMDPAVVDTFVISIAQ